MNANQGFWLTAARCALRTSIAALHQLLRVVELLDDQRDVHPRLARKPLAPAVDTVLADQRERIGQQIERDRQTPARSAHHRFVVLERVAVLLEDRHSLGADPSSARFFGGLTAAARRGWAGCADCAAAG